MKNYVWAWLKKHQASVKNYLCSLFFSKLLCRHVKLLNHFPCCKMPLVCQSGLGRGGGKWGLQADVLLIFDFWCFSKAVLALAASWTSRQVGERTLTGTVIDSGDGVTHVIPVVSVPQSCTRASMENSLSSKFSEVYTYTHSSTDRSLQKHQIIPRAVGVSFGSFCSAETPELLCNPEFGRANCLSVIYLERWIAKATLSDGWNCFSTFSIWFAAKSE